MKHASLIWICFLFLMFLFSCEEERGNLTSVNRENAYIFGVWKAPTTDSVQETVTAISVNIQEIAQNETVSQVSKNGEVGSAYNTFPILTTAAPETLLPENGEVTDWVRAGNPTTFDSETLYRDRIVLSEDDRDIYRNYGMQGQAEVEYQSPKFGSVPYISFEIFDMGTPENAFGIFSVHSYPDPKFEWIGCKAIISGKYLWFWKGKYFVQVEGYEIATGIRKAMVSLAEVTARQIQDPPQKIPFLELLPDQYVRGSEKFFKTDWALHQVNKSLPKPFPQLSDDIIGVSAQCNVRSKNPSYSYNVFVIRFPTVAEAQSTYKQYQNALMSENVSFETDSQSGAILIDEQFAEP